MENDNKSGKFKSIATAIGLELLTSLSGNRPSTPEISPIETVIQDEDMDVFTNENSQNITAEEKRKNDIEQASQEEKDLVGAIEQSRMTELEKKKEEEKEYIQENELEDSPGSGNHRELYSDKSIELDVESPDDADQLDREEEPNTPLLEDWNELEEVNDEVEPVEENSWEDQEMDYEVEDLEVFEPEVEDLYNEDLSEQNDSEITDIELSSDIEAGLEDYKGD